MALAVVGVIGPGLFQLKPPQWFGAETELAHVETLAPPTELGGEAALLDDGLVEQTALSAKTPLALPVEEAAPLDSAGSVTLAKAPAPPLAVIGTEEAETLPLRGPNTATTETRLAAVQQSAVPELPAIKARREPLTPAVPEAAVRPAKVPAIPPAVSNAAPVPVIVSREFIRNIPDSHQGLPVKQQKDNFVAIVLPLILAANEEIAQRRSAVLRAAESNDVDTLGRWARLYRVKTDNRSIGQIEAEILLRADFIPVSLALAQAAIESGWGTSRFARQGNALFGQWAWQASAGIKPAQASNSRAVVRSFPNLFGSVRAYMHNLNTHASYASFRDRRKIIRGRSRSDLGYQLANHLDSYAEIGTAYVDKLQTLIRSNDFGRFEAAKLR